MAKQNEQVKLDEEALALLAWCAEVEECSWLPLARLECESAVAY